MFFVVTGASSGIGKEVALTLAKQGKVIALARSTEKLAALEQEDSQIIAYPFDLKDGNFDELINFIKKHTQEVHGLVNNAGLLINKLFNDQTEEDIENQFQVNLMGPAKLSKKLFPLLKAGKGHVVNISSMGGYQGASKFPGLSSYSAAKGAISILTECLATEWLESEIKVNALCLGAVNTEMLNTAFPGFEAPVSAKMMGDYIANFVVTGSKFYNGKIIPVALQNPS